MIGYADDSADDAMEREVRLRRRAAGKRPGGCIWCGCVLGPEDYEFTCEACHRPPQGEEEIHE